MHRAPGCHLVTAFTDYRPDLGRGLEPRCASRREAAVIDKLGALPAIIRAGEPLVSGWLGLPPEASAAFVMGFLRRDFGATGLFAMAHSLSPVQAVVGMITITLFIPCFASLMMMVKEQGARIAIAMVAIIVPFAFFIGGLFNLALRAIW